MKYFIIKINSPKDKLWLCLPAIVAGILDLIVTLLGQPDKYWRGSYNMVSEANPIGHWFLRMHPLSFVCYDFAELAIICIMIIVLPAIISKSLSVFYTIGSAKAFYNWMYGLLHLGLVSNLMLIIPTIALVYSFGKASEYENS